MHFNPAIMPGDAPGITKDDLFLRERFKSAREYFINPTNGSNNNNGRSRARPWSSITHAYTYAQKNFDLGGYGITFRLTGNVSIATTIDGPLVGHSGPNSVVIAGTSGSPSTISISSSTASAIMLYVRRGAMLKVQDLTIASSGASGFCLCTEGGATEIGFSNLRFGATGGSHLFAAGGYLHADAAYEIFGGCNIHSVCENNGQISVTRAVTVTGTPSFVTAFVQSDLGGMQEWTGASFAGSATGSRYNAILSGIINTGGGGANFFPGNSAGTANTGGVYV